MPNTIQYMTHPACSKTPKIQALLPQITDRPLVHRDLTQDMLRADEILDIAQSLGVKVQELLRPSSPVYAERQAELYAMDDAELAAVIATEPTLIKRPIVKTESGYVVGLDEAQIEVLLQK